MYDRIFANFNPPESFRPNNKKDPLTKKFMRDEKILTLWQPGKEDKRVMTELVDGNKLIKHVMHLLLMGSVPFKIVAEKLNKRYGMNPKITERMIATYSHYFWNVTNTSLLEWEKVLSDDPSSGALVSALSCGDQQALYRAGFNPRVDGTRSMKEAYRQAYYRVEALRYAPDSKVTIDAFSKLTARMMGLHEILYSQGSGLQDQLRQFRQIMMTHKDPDVTAVDKIIDKLEGGSYSGDGSEELSLKGDRLQ
jgi:hypothetical protein